MDLGKITGSKIASFRDSSNNIMQLQVQMTSDDDVKTVNIFGHAGEEWRPPVGSIAIIDWIDEAWGIAIAIDDGIAPTIDPGEKKIYASDGNGNIIASIYLDKNGKIHIEANGDIDIIANSGSGTIKLNDDSDNAVAYSKLKDAFNQLKNDFNNFVTQTYNLHNHPSAPVGPVSVPSVVGTSSSADITQAKIASIKVPSS